MSTRTWFRIHSFTGVITGLMLFVICWSGTFAVLSAELDWLAGAHWRADEPVRDAGQIDWQGVEATLRDTNTGSEPLRDYLLYLAVPGGTGTLTATVRDAGQQRFELLHLDPGSGALLGVDTLTVQRFFRDFHRRLYFPQPWGLYLVSAFAVTMLVSTVAALVFYKRWWTRFFRFKPGGGRRLWSELHKSIGLWSLWFAAVIVITSLWYLFEGLRVHHGDGVINYVGGDDYAAIQLSEAPSGAETEPLPLAELMARAQQARPDLSVRSLRFEDDGRLYIDGQAGHLLVRDRANQLHLDAATGEVLHSHSADELPLYWRWSDTADPLHFGDFGGRYVPETLVEAHRELEVAYAEAKADPDFQAQIVEMRKQYVGGPTPLYHAKRLTAHCGGAQIYLKREELAFTGAHKINNAVGQGLLALRLGKKRIIAETGAGQHGVATATICTADGLDGIRPAASFASCTASSRVGARTRSLRRSSALSPPRWPRRSSDGRRKARDLPEPVSAWRRRLSPA